MAESSRSRADLQETVDAHAVAAGVFGGLLRNLSRSDDLTAGGQWTVRHTAVHTTGCMKLYRHVLSGQRSAIRGAEDLDVVNEAWFLMIEEDRPVVLADVVVAGAAALNADAMKLEDDHQSGVYFGRTFTPVDLVALGCNEILQHGWDIATATGQPFDSRGAAEIAVPHLAPVWCPMFRADFGEGATVGIILEGAKPFYYRVAGDALVLAASEPGDKYDCIISGAAFSYMLWIGGRVGWRASGLKVSGPRPELSRTFGWPT